MPVLDRFWEQDAAKFLQDRWQGNAASCFDREETLQVLHQAFADCQGTLLDIGCGPGFWLQQTSGFPFCQLGIDRSAAMVRLAQETGGQVLLADAHALPLGQDQFDAVMSIHVLEYSPDPQQFLREARRVLRPGGRCCLVTKNKFGLPWLWAKWISERVATNPLMFNCVTVEELTTMWGSPPLDVIWISARLITDLNDVNDAVHLALPRWAEHLTLWGALLLRPLFKRTWLGKFFAWHVAVVFEKEYTER